MIKFQGKGAVDAVEGLKRLGQFAPLAVRRTLSKSLRLYRNSIQSFVQPVTTPGHSAENIRNAVGYRVRLGGGEVIQAKVGINVGKKNPRRRVKKGETVSQFNARKTLVVLRNPKDMALPHAHLVILGTGDRYKKSTGQYTGRMRKGYPFVKRGVESADPRVRAAFPKWLQEEIERESRKRGR